MAFFRYLLTLSILILFIACESNDTTPISRSELLSGSNSSGKVWQITTISLTLGGLNINECSNECLEQCIADNFIRYYPDGVYEVTEGRQKCNPTDPPAITGTWRLSQDEETLFVTMNDSSNTWEIESLANNSHRISGMFFDGTRAFTLSTP